MSDDKEAKEKGIRGEPAYKACALLVKLGLLLLKRQRAEPELTAAALWRTVVARTDEIYLAVEDLVATDDDDADASTPAAKAPAPAERAAPAVTAAPAPGDGGSGVAEDAQEPAQSSNGRQSSRQKSTDKGKQSGKRKAKAKGAAKAGKASKAPAPAPVVVTDQPFDEAVELSSDESVDGDGGDEGDQQDAADATTQAVKAPAPAPALAATSAAASAPVLSAGQLAEGAVVVTLFKPKQSSTLGITLTSDPAPEAPIYVSKLAPGALGAQSSTLLPGLLVGDRLLQVNGTVATSHGEASALIKEAAGYVHLVVVRASRARKRGQSILQRAVAELLRSVGAGGDDSSQLSHEEHERREEQKAHRARELAAKKRDLEQKVAAAEPALAKASAALDSLNDSDLRDLKSFKRPPDGVSDVTAACLCLLQAEELPFEKVDTSWRAAQAMLMSPQKFIEVMLGFKKKIDDDLVPKSAFANIRHLLRLEHFNVDTQRKMSSAAAGLTDFIINITVYYDINEDVKPLRKDLADALRTEQALSATSQGKVEVLFGPLKDPVRIVEKAHDDYREYFDDGELAEANVLDVVRCRLIASSEVLLPAIHDALKGTFKCTLTLPWLVAGGLTVVMQLVRSKNKFGHSQLDPTRFRYLILNVRVTWGSVSTAERSAFFEIQLHHERILGYNDEAHAHDHYNYFRSRLADSYESGLDAALVCPSPSARTDLAPSTFWKCHARAVVCPSAWAQTSAPMTTRILLRPSARPTMAILHRCGNAAGARRRLPANPNPNPNPNQERVVAFLVEIKGVPVLLSILVVVLGGADRAAADSIVLPTNRYELYKMAFEAILRRQSASAGAGDAAEALAVRQLLSRVALDNTQAVNRREFNLRHVRSVLSTQQVRTPAVDTPFC